MPHTVDRVLVDQLERATVTDDLALKLVELGLVDKVYKEIASLACLTSVPQFGDYQTETRELDFYYADVLLSILETLVGIAKNSPGTEEFGRVKKLRQGLVLFNNCAAALRNLAKELCTEMEWDEKSQIREWGQKTGDRILTLYDAEVRDAMAHVVPRRLAWILTHSCFRACRFARRSSAGFKICPTCLQISPARRPKTWTVAKTHIPQWPRFCSTVLNRTERCSPVQRKSY